jgi:K+-transporting ATPase A subunit
VDAIGNFFVDLVRSTLYVLLPLSLVVALLLAWQGVPQTFAGSVTVPLLRAALTARGFRLVEAETAAAAEIAATSQRPDLVLRDLGLPNADGIDVTRRLRE